MAGTTKKTTTAKKTTAAKTTAAKKTTTAAAKKPVARAKKAEVKTVVSIQYAGRDFTTDSLVERVKEIYGGNAEDIKTVNVYVKTEENKVYYVVNDTETGSFDI